MVPEKRSRTALRLAKRLKVQRPSVRPVLYGVPRQPHVVSGQFGRPRCWPARSRIRRQTGHCPSSRCAGAVDIGWCQPEKRGKTTILLRQVKGTGRREAAQGRQAWRPGRGRAPGQAGPADSSGPGYGDPGQPFGRIGGPRPGAPALLLTPWSADLATTPDVPPPADPSPRPRRGPSFSPRPAGVKRTRRRPGMRPLPPLFFSPDRASRPC